ncbi:MAG: hypothetical protein P4L77_10670 [Sulfuriferula sp.]|nr:hypothetical protein [Sulfuriferula sp.]
MGIKALIAALRGNSQPRNAYNEREIKFFKEARMAKEHGRVVVSHMSLGLDHVEVPFVFPGMSEPPKLDDRLMTDIRSAAESQGYIFHYLNPHRYGMLVPDQPAFSAAVSQAVEEFKHIGELTEDTCKALVEAIGEQIAAHEEAVRRSAEANPPTGVHADSLQRMADHLASVTPPVSQPKRAVARTPCAAAIVLGGQSVDDFIKEYVDKWIVQNPNIHDSIINMDDESQEKIVKLLQDRTGKGIHSLGETAEQTNDALVQIVEQFQRDVIGGSAWAPGTRGLAEVGGSMTLGSEVGTGEGQLKFSRTNGDTAQH